MKYLLAVIMLVALAGCDPTQSNTNVVQDCRRFAPPECIRASVSGNRTEEWNSARDAYRFCYCLHQNRTEVIMYGAPTEALRSSLRMR